VHLNEAHFHEPLITSRVVSRSSAPSVTMSSATQTINIRLMANAATFSVDVDFSSTVLELKRLIAGSDNADCEPDRQKLVYKGKILKDDDTLESYGMFETCISTTPSGGMVPRGFRAILNSLSSCLGVKHPFWDISTPSRKL